MISFACAGCGHKLQVPNEVAGKSVRCSLCKHVMLIAAPVPVAATVGLPSLDGQPSSLARAGLDGGVTVGLQGDSAQDSPTNSTSPRSPQALLSSNGASRRERYQVVGEIARGGMGAVLRAVDCDIRREVAVKYLLDQSDARKKARFIEEAQITGQLEHPNVVPIHELGVDAQKRLFFSMKMVRGRSLASVLRDLREVPRVAEKEYPLGRLLTIFVNICHALAYAHSRGVVHRDLKPDNIMLGDFGEVYVMDWGLAKVLQHSDAETPAAVIQGSPSFAWAQQPSSSVSASSVQTSRLDSEDRTVDGTVMGTPVYMPPEQARGEQAAIDQRSDIYSLGAVLYEVLTLSPPIEKTGGFLAILMRVQDGKIVPPAQREPARARAGKIPPELAAVAMKALAPKQEDRYQTVEALRGDIERFLVGRSVSVKEDSRREAFIKFVKRNKGFSVGAAAALLILLFSSIFLLQSWLATRRAYAAYQKEQQDKRTQARQSVPALVEAARVAVQRRKFDDALAQMNMAVDYDPNNAAARLLRAELLAARKDFTAARPELEHYLKLQPKDAQAARLIRLCRSNRPDDPAVLAELADVLLRHDLPTLAEGLLTAPEKLLEVYRRQIEDAWPGLGKRLTMGKGNKLSMSLDNTTPVLSLTPLQGIPLRELSLSTLKIRDLAPLAGMPLTHLTIASCTEVDDLAPLASMPLTYLNLGGCSQVKDLSPLAGMRLTYLNISNCSQIKDLAPLAAMPLTFLNFNSCVQVKDLSPLAGLPLTHLELSGCQQIKTLAPLAGMPLTFLNVNGCSQVKDLAPLAGMPLSTLSLSQPHQIKDLTLLADMPLTQLTIGNCPQLKKVGLPRITTLKMLSLVGCGGIGDLSPFQGTSLTTLSFQSSDTRELLPLNGIALTHLGFNSCGIADLTPFRGMPLTHLIIVSGGSIGDLTPLTGMPLTSLTLNNCGSFTDLKPLARLPLTHLDLRACEKVTDLAPLAGMELQSLLITTRTIQHGMEGLRRMKSLTTINSIPVAKFWKELDAGKYP